MSHFHKHPGGQRISKQTVVVEGNKVVVGVWGHLDGDKKPLDVLNSGDDLMISNEGVVGESSIWTITVKPSARSKKEVKDTLFANTSKWETWDTFNIVFRPVGETAAPAKIARLSAPDGCGTVVNGTVWAPNEFSLSRDEVIEWSGVSGSGTVHYFQLGADVVPNYFGALVPHGVSDPQHVNLFFHPTPSQAGYKDGDYKSKAGGWPRIFHYLTDSMAVQFCSAASKQVLIMPLLTTAAAGSCGIFAAQWESLVSQILGLLSADLQGKPSGPKPVSSLVVSSFSSGIAYSSSFRTQAKLGGKLKGVIDFDGIISSSKKASLALAAAKPYPVVRAWQGGVPKSQIATLATQHYFGMDRVRWAKGPYSFPENPRAAMFQIHGVIPQTMMAVAANRTRAK